VHAKAHQGRLARAEALPAHVELQKPLAFSALAGMLDVVWGWVLDHCCFQAVAACMLRAIACAS
jgi:hypothetical protein